MSSESSASVPGSGEEEWQCPPSAYEDDDAATPARDESGTAGATKTGSSSSAAGHARDLSTLTSEEVAYWLQTFDAAHSSPASLMCVSHRFLRAQVITLANRIRAIQQREREGSQRKWEERQREKERSRTTELLPPKNPLPASFFSQNAPLRLMDSAAASTNTVAASSSESTALVAPSSSSSTLTTSTPLIPSITRGPKHLSARRAALKANQQAAAAAEGTAPEGAAARNKGVTERKRDHLENAFVTPVTANTPALMPSNAGNDETANSTTNASEPAPTAAAPSPQLNKHQMQDLTRTARQLRHLTANRCYVCKTSLQRHEEESIAAAASSSGATAAPSPSAASPSTASPRHPTFTNHCLACGTLNDQKRDTLIDLRGKIAVLTGGRIKIGYQIALRLLRCGCTLLATSRFPANALARFQQEQDYPVWKEQLHLLYADLCNPAEVQALAARIKARVPHVDILINNAAQTVRRPKPYYAQLNRIETESRQRLLLMAEQTNTPFTIEVQPQIQQEHHARSIEAPHEPSSSSSSSSSIASVGAVLSHIQLDHPQAGDHMKHHSLVAAAANVRPPNTVVVAEEEGKSDHAEEEITIAAARPDRIAHLDLPASSSSSLSAPTTTTALASPSPSPSPSPLPSLSLLRIPGSGAVELLAHSAPYQPFSHIAREDDLAPGEVERLFPNGKVDVENDHEPLDLRAGNSWNARAVDVDPRELAEVLSTNAMAPFILTTALYEWFKKSPNPRRYVILVSSMEGKLNRTKADQHAHTNMAKAALNALTRSISAEWALERVYVNSVDTGWNSQERAVNDPLRDPSFETPLDCADGAARVLDPIFVGETTGRIIVGQFLKDYEPTEW
jgi:NAD(P)-dependent dehydrogenase (short-subunit alcohol dehydrogenase family)